MLRQLLYRALGYKNARAMADQIESLNGYQAFDAVAKILNLRLNVEGLHHVPKAGRMVVIADHPTGLADGVAAFDALKARRPDLTFLANADALRVVPKGEDLIIPVEWVLEKRSRETARATLMGIKAAMCDERCIVMFPAGKLAGLTVKGLKDKPWASSAAALARKYNAPIAPLHISARNSVLYYLFCVLSGELRDITLFHELLNKAGKTFDLTFGPLVKAADLPKNAEHASAMIRQIVTQQLAITELAITE
jgi:putative hemolysin